MELCPTDEGHSNIAFTGFYELALTAEILTHARRGGLMVDVGANYGYFTMLWAGSQKQNRVIAFEASPGNQEALGRNVTLNDFDARVEVRPVALGREAGSLSFAPSTQGQTGWGGFAPAPTASTVEVPVVTLDESLPPGIEVDVLKIDVEGADTWVLFGAERLLRRRQINHVYFEHNKKCMGVLGIGENEALEFLESVGYRAEPLDDPSGAIVEYHAVPA